MDESAIKSFTTSARSAQDEAEDAGLPTTVPFELDGTTFHAHRPKTSIFLMMAASGGSGRIGESMLEAVKFIDACLPPDERDIIADRLRDPDDDFDIDDLSAIFEYLVTQFSGRPTESQSD